MNLYSSLMSPCTLEKSAVEFPDAVLSLALLYLPGELGVLSVTTFLVLGSIAHILGELGEFLMVSVESGQYIVTLIDTTMG